MYMYLCPIQWVTLGSLIASKEVKSLCQFSPFSRGNVMCISVINEVVQVPIGYIAIMIIVPYI